MGLIDRLLTWLRSRKPNPHQGEYEPETDKYKRPEKEGSKPKIINLITFRW